MARRYNMYLSTPAVPLSESAMIFMWLCPRGFLSEATACYTKQVNPLYRVKKNKIMHPLYWTGYEVIVIRGYRLISNAKNWYLDDIGARGWVLKTMTYQHHFFVILSLLFFLKKIKCHLKCLGFILGRGMLIFFFLFVLELLFNKFPLEYCLWHFPQLR